jgi:hypothetical protein
MFIVDAYHIKPRDIVEAARDMARKSRDLMAPTLAAANLPPEVAADTLRNRMEIVMDCYLTGAEEMLRRLHGDSDPEPWREDYDHETRLRELLRKYDLLDD